MYNTSNNALPGWNTPMVLGTWQTYALRANSSNGISIWNNMSLVVNEYNTDLQYYFFDRVFTSCLIGKSWWAADGPSYMDLRALIILDTNLSDAEFDSLHQYVNSLPVNDPVLVSPPVPNPTIRWAPAGPVGPARSL